MENRAGSEGGAKAESLRATLLFNGNRVLPAWNSVFKRLYPLLQPEK